MAQWCLTQQIPARALPLSLTHFQRLIKWNVIWIRNWNRTNEVRGKGEKYPRKCVHTDFMWFLLNLIWETCMMMTMKFSCLSSACVSAFIIIAHHSSCFPCNFMFFFYSFYINLIRMELYDCKGNQILFQSL